MLKRLAIVVSLVLLVSVPAFGSHYQGIRITPTGIDPSSNVVDVDFTVWIDQGGFVSVIAATDPPSYFSGIAYVDWGDGEFNYGSATSTYLVEGGTLLGQEEGGPAADWFGEDTIYAYRRSLSHTYETEGQNFTIVATSGCCPNEQLYAGGGNSEYATAQAVVTAAALPTLPQTGVIVLALGLAGLGAILLRRTATS